MCRNHSHATVTTAVVLGNGDGTSVILAEVGTEIAIEDSSTGLRLTAPQGTTLLIVLQRPEEESSLQDRVTGALAELLSMDLKTHHSSGGDTSPLTPKTPW
jgi:hypothetical protein